MRRRASGRRRAWPVRAAATLALLGCCLPASATSLQISPVRVDLPAGPGAAALTLRNTADTPIHAQVRVFRWTQADGADVLAPADDVVASPPIVQIGGQAEQMIRVVRPGKAGTPGETAYRLLIDELPRRDAPVDQSGVRVQLRYSVPVFAGTPTEAPPPALALTLWRDGSEWWLGMRNGGTRHARVSDAALVNGAQRVPLTAGLLGYALPGALRVWKVRVPPGFTPAAGLRLDTAINGEPQSLPVPNVLSGRPDAGT
ncbi:fimbrial biogenesis chaperone [Cupriavidus agavae]|uniref:Fimbrial chaperone protein n=1 Tax=Cupriavidus agavae TaxID=1001822 RepID=A0A4Q7RZZ9_9BURK|nr:molecular chaperone [Cupriavidus agavae]RZT39466.1 fimbrial chaperone protein [Cupriavidus agavae]